MAGIAVHPTPNPNSLKFTSGGPVFIDAGMESFSAPEEAEGHVLGERLFAIPGVANVFILPQFLTITKHPAADWDMLLPKIEGTLASYLAEKAGS